MTLNYNGISSYLGRINISSKEYYSYRNAFHSVKNDNPLLTSAMTFPILHIF